MKYFLVQSLASSLFLLASLLGILLVNSSLNFFIYVALFLKLGAVPFHGWFISLLKSVNMWILFFLCTFQKVIPLIIISSLNSWVLILLGIIIFNSMIIFFNSFIMLSLNSILAYSSINNLSWMLLGLLNSLKVTSIFFAIYTFLLVGILLFFWNPTASTFIQIQSFNYWNKLMILLVMMSLGGLPPLMGFLGKVLILKNTIYLVSLVFILVLIFSSLSILFLYLSYSFISMSMFPSSFVSLKSKNFSGLKSFYSFTFSGFTIFSLLSM